MQIRPWWLCGLERVSNSSRHSLEGPEIDPHLGHGTIMDLLPWTCVICGGNGLNWSLPMHRGIDQSGYKPQNQNPP